jgi:long-chain acyl-CoA synthetase
VIQGYGLTESTSLISVNHPLKPGKGSIGKALPGREIRLDDDGEILVRGDNIAAGYLQASGLRPVLEKGWFHTGDLGAIDEGGNLYFKGRKKGVIVTAEGMKVHPEDLESALRRQPEVGDCVVIGLQQGGNAEPCAVLVLRDRAADPAAIVRSANASLAGYQHMRRWFVWPEEDLPRTSTQKPRTEVIRQLVESRLAGQDSASPRSGGIAELIARIVGQRAGSIPPAAGLTSELDLSSVDRVELLSAIEDRYQVDLEESQFTAATTLEDLEAMLHRPRTGPSGHKYPRWALSLPVRMVRLAAYDLLIRPLTRLLARPEIRGRQNLSKVSGPLLVISNHVTEVDACLILAALPPRFRRRLAVAMSGEMLRTMRRPPREMSPVKRVREMLSYWLVTGLFNVFPLPQESGFRESFAFAGEAADRGFSILVFPEGHRTRDGAIAPFQSGIGLLAKNLRLPVLPMRIDGLYELKLRGRRSARRGEIVVSIGMPILVGSEEPLETIARKLREQVSSVPNS